MVDASDARSSSAPDSRPVRLSETAPPGPRPHAAAVAAECADLVSNGAPPLSKREARARVWREMEIRGVIRFPGSAGRIPNFVGAERAALQLQTLRAWREARAVRIGPDAPQLAVRRMALRQGKVVYIALPGSRSLGYFLELDPDRLGKRALQAASIRGAERLGRPIGVEAMPPIDLIVCGAVAVNARGARVGKGGGLSDLEYGLLAEAGRVGPGTPIVTTVHPVQILPQAIEMRRHDVPVDVVVTADGLIGLRPDFPRPAGVYREELLPDQLGDIERLLRDGA